MKVRIRLITESEEERAELLVHERDSSVERLADYIETEAYRSVVILCGNGEDIYRVPCTDTVSYTHLDVYKRQGSNRAVQWKPL